MNDKKIVIEIEIDIPDEFDINCSDSEMFQLKHDIERRFEEVTGYSIQNVYIEIKD